MDWTGLIEPLLGVFVKAWHRLRGTNEPDRRLFAELLKALPSDGAMQFVRDHDMGGKFLRDRLVPIWDFPARWDNAEHEFHDGVLEKKRKVLLELVRRFGLEVATKTFPYGQRYQGLSDMWPEEDVEEARQLLNDLGDQLAAAHQDLVRTAKKRLNV